MLPPSPPPLSFVGVLLFYLSDSSVETNMAQCSVLEGSVWLGCARDSIKCPSARGSEIDSPSVKIIGITPLGSKTVAFLKSSWSGVGESLPHGLGRPYPVIHLH